MKSNLPLQDAREIPGELGEEWVGLGRGGRGQAGLLRSLAQDRIGHKNLKGVLKYWDNINRELSGEKRTTTHPWLMVFTDPSLS